MVRQSDRLLININSNGTDGFVIALQKKNPPIWPFAGISTSLRKTSMFTIQICGAVPSWLRRANARPFKNYAKSACATRCGSIRRKANSSVGGTIKCARSKKIAACALTQFWRAKSWQQNALRPGLIARCARVKSLPITRRCGRSLEIKKTPNAQRRTQSSELDVERWALKVGIDA